MSIFLENICKRYGTVEAVKDLTLFCPEGQMLALLGPSGCGKSSTLKMIAGIEPVSSGTLKISDRDVAQLAPGERNIAMVFEDYALYPHYTVFENIAFPLRLRHVPRAELTKCVNEMIALLRLEDIAHERVKTLSGGAQQRVSIGRALVRDPDVILFDEPLSHLDADQKIQLRTEIKRLQQTQGLTSILVTHDQTEAIAMSDLIAVMDNGVLQQVGSPQTLYEKPANTFVATFIGEPPMNLLPATISNKSGNVTLVGETWSLHLDGEKADRMRGMNSADVIVGLRPEHLKLHLNGATGPDLAVLSGEIFFREHRGDTDVLLVDVRGDGSAQTDARISADIPGPSALREGDYVNLGFDAEHVCLFDSGCQRNVMA